MLGGKEGRRQVPGRAPADGGPRSHVRTPTAADSMALWGLGGAMVVVAFWVAVGALPLADRPRPEAPPLRDALSTEAPGCTTLTLDRHLGRTIAEPCQRPAPLPDIVASRLADLSRP